MPDERRILGGVFGLESQLAPNRAAPPPFAAANTQYFLSVRCALHAIAQAHRPGAAWLPSYLCGAMLAPFEQGRVPIRFYAVGPDIHWINEIQAGDLVVVIHYFGFPNSNFPAAQVRNRGALIIEDASQALFLPQQFPESTCVLYSPRKFVGVPDSGVMASRDATGTESAQLADAPQEWWNGALVVSLKRWGFDRTGQPDDWYPLFQSVETEFPIGPYRASDLSRELLAAIDYETIGAQRRANYWKLLESLSEFGLFPDLDPDVVPLGFPVRVEPGARDQILRRLHEKRIYAPVHWRIDKVVPAQFLASHELARTEITLLCDQRCSLEDMDWQAREFLAALSESTKRG